MNERLRALFGEPKALSDPQSHLWSIIAPKGRFEVCYTFEESTDRASLWIHDVTTGWSDTYTFDLSIPSEESSLIAFIFNSTGLR